MSGKPGTSGTVHNEAERENKRQAARLATASRVANRAAAQAEHKANLSADADTETDPQHDIDVPDAIDADGSAMPRPSRLLRDYPSEAERQLSWTRYQSGVQRALDVKTKMRDLYPAADVRAWCTRVQAVINRMLPAVQTWAETIPDLTDKQREALRDRARKWDINIRETLAREVIE